MKEDPNHIAKVEKAIAQKYGKETIQNPKANWDEEKEREYLEQLKKLSDKEDKIKEKSEKVETNGFFVSKKLLTKDTKRECPVCDKYSFKIKDDVYMTKFECCYDCYIQYVDGREERWQKGWRPDRRKD
jgi:hypothetical protein